MVYHYIKVKVNSNIKPSFFTGSAIRGAFGRSLQEKSCIAKDDSCLYCQFFEKQMEYRLFRFEISLDAPNFDFGLYIFGEACTQVALVLSALNSMLNEYGIGSKRVKFPQSIFYLNGKKVFENQKFLPFSAKTENLVIEKYHRNVTIKILTPSLFKKTNSTFKSDINLEDILLSIYKHVSSLESDTTYLAPTTPQYTLISKKLNSVKTTRRSDRQQKTVVYEGLTGEIIVKHLDPKSYALLLYGEIVAIGNKTVFGYGSICIQKDS